MVSKKVKVINPSGLHLRPAGVLSNAAVKFEGCAITFRFGNVSGNAKSVLSVLGACVSCGDELEFTCKGKNEEQALETIVSLIESGLGEEI